MKEIQIFLHSNQLSVIFDAHCPCLHNNQGVSKGPPAVNLVEGPPGSAGSHSEHQSWQSRTVSKELVGSSTLPHCESNSETKVNTPALHFPPEHHTQAAGPATFPLAAVIFGQVTSPCAWSDPAPLVHWPTGLLPCKLEPEPLPVPYVLSLF